MLVASASGATAAQAVEFHTEGGEKTTITGTLPSGEETPSEEEAFTFTVNNGSFFCLATTFDGIMLGKTASSITLFPSISKCFAISMSMGACDFSIKSSGGFEIGGGVACSLEPIELNIGCKIKFGPQFRSSGITYANQESGTKRDVTTTFNVTGLHYTQTGFGCSGGAGTFLNGKLHGIATFKADNAEATQQGFWVE